RLSHARADGHDDPDPARGVRQPDAIALGTPRRRGTTSRCEVWSSRADACLESPDFRHRVSVCRWRPHVCESNLTSAPAQPSSWQQCTSRVVRPKRGRTIMSIEDNKAVVGRWFTEFWGPDYNPAVIVELAAPDIRFEYSLHAPCRGRDE